MATPSASVASSVSWQFAGPFTFSNPQRRSVRPHMWRRRQQCKFLPHRSLVCILCHSISRRSNYFKGMHRQLHLRLLRVSRRPLQIAIEHKVETKKKAVPGKAAGQTWEDPTLADWSENDYRLFCGDLGNEVNDDVLSKTFSRFPAFNMD